MKIFFNIILFTGLLSCSSKQEGFYLPAEWEQQSGVIVGDPDDSAAFEMIKHISKKMKVYCFIIDSTEETYRKQFKEAGITFDSIHFLSSPIGFSYAARDGLLFLKNEKDEKQLMNFAWNTYGWYFEPEYKSYIETDKQNRETYATLYSKAFPFPLITSSMVNEGGAIETNGKGTIILVESVNIHRNPHMTKEEQEAELKKTLNAKKIIWLKEGVADDPFGWGKHITENYFGIGVGGHIDEFCRFVNENTILLAFPDSAEAEKDPLQKITLERMKVNYEILKNATDQDGKPFTIVKMPVPDPEYMTFTLDTANTDDEIKFLSKRIINEQKELSLADTVHFAPSTSYVNFLITNTLVFEAKYWVEGKPETSRAKDEAVKKILEQYFPHRKIIQINPISLNHSGGGLHCWTQQVPK